MNRYYNPSKKVKIRMKIEYILTKQTDFDKHRVTLLLIIKKQSIYHSEILALILFKYVVYWLFLLIFI